MNFSSKNSFLILTILIVNFQYYYSEPAYASDSLKVGIVFKTTNQVDLDSMSVQLVRSFDLDSKFNLVPVDTNIIVTIEPFVIDSTTFDSLKQRGFNGLIIGSFTIEDSVQFLNFNAMKNRDVVPTQISKIKITQDDVDSNLFLVTKKLLDYFQPEHELQGQFRVILASLQVSEKDSASISYREALADTLKAIFSSPQFSNIHIEFLENDTLNRLNNKSVVDKDSARSNYFHNDAQLVISGKIEYDDEQNLVYYPHLRFNDNSNPGNQQFEKNKALSCKMCLLKDFSLHPVTINKLNRFTDFLFAYFLIQNEQYDEAIHELKDFDSMADYFFLAESYFNRGLIRKNDLPVARADWDSCVIYLKASLTGAESLADSICIENNLGVSNQLLGNIDSATVYYTAAYDMLNSAPFSDGFVRVSNNLGNIFLLSGQWKKALNIFQAGVEFMEQSEDSLNLAATYENLATIYQLIMQRNKAVNYYEKAFAIRKSMNDEAGMATAYIYLGDVYQEMKDFDRAKSNYQKGLTISRRLHNEPGIAESSNRLGQVFQETNILDSALVYYQQGYDTFEILGDQDGLIRTVIYQASVHQKLKDFEKATALYEKALEFADGENSKNIKAKIYDRLGDIYNNQQNLITAYDYYENSADLYEQLENFETLSLILYNMGLIKLKQNDYAEGYQLLKRAITLDEEHGFNNLSGEQDFLDQLEGVLKKD